MVVTLHRTSYLRLLPSLSSPYPLSILREREHDQLFVAQESESKKKGLKMNPVRTRDVTVLMMASDKSHPGLINSLESLNKYGYQHTVLGLGEQFGGWRHRMQKYRDAASDLAKIDSDALVVCMDAYDAISLRSSAGLVETFETFGKPLVLSLEKVCMGNCVPIDDWWKNEGSQHLGPKGRLPKDRYVNGGLLMGYAWAVRDLYDWMLKRGERDDQRGLGSYALAHRQQWAPDVNGKIFRNKLWGDTLTEEDLTGQGIYFAHFPGLGWGGIASYEKAVNAILKRPSNVKCPNLGSPVQFAAKIILLLIAIILLLCFFFLLYRQFSAPHMPAGIDANTQR